MKNNTKDDINFKLSQLTVRLEHLEIEYRRESNQIREEIEKLRSEQTESIKQVPSNQDQIIRGGCTVRVTNKYKGLKGTIGKVSKIDIDGYWVWFITKDGSKYRRTSSNLQVLEYEFEYYQQTNK